MSTPDVSPDDRFWRQLDVVNAALPPGQRAVAGPRGASRGSAVRPEYAHLADHVLVRADDESRSRALIQQNFADAGPAAVVWPPERHRERVRTRRLHVPGRDAHGVAETLQAGGVDASPVHLVSVAGVNLCPGDEPVPTAAPLRPPLGDRARGAGVTVTVIDTGLVHDYLDHPWLASGPQVGGDVTALLDEVDADGGIKPYVGHGTFIAGVLRCVAPAADVRVHDGFPYGGAIMEDELGLLLLQILDEHGWPDIISLSAGTRTQDALTLAGLSDFVDELAAHPGTVLVAAAGNDGGTGKFWPAAFADEPVNAQGDVVVSVGALREDGTGRACFSNHGSWVKTFAPGERLVNAFTSGTYAYHYPAAGSCRHSSPALYAGCTCVAPFSSGDKEKFTGLSAWSGTSFATPVIAGLIAARMSETGVGSRQAALDVVEGRVPVPDLSGS
ncbi:S8/S53 family peptidase [Nonomuraea sp. NPDC005983]|uniref:S8 family peptidase n=1 Tax=Nonomuraea sp. NPDC005983 TaxID=3155595 RepID=UPI0033A19C4D